MSELGRVDESAVIGCEGREVEGGQCWVIGPGDVKGVGGGPSVATGRGRYQPC